LVALATASTQTVNDTLRFLAVVASAATPLEFVDADTVSLWLPLNVAVTVAPSTAAPFSSSTVIAAVACLLGPPPADPGTMEPTCIDWPPPPPPIAEPPSTVKPLS
jgi:hypothetical protein